MKKHGLTQADFDEFTDYDDNEPYREDYEGAGGRRLRKPNERTRPSLRARRG
jgi:hypothetical protein